MRVIDVDNMNVAESNGRVTEFTGGTSIRPILASDGMGFSLHKTIIPKGGPHRWHYKNHMEACYCIQGEGVLTDLSTGNSYNILPGVLYALDNHDDHTFEAIEDTVLISVFNPPVCGNECHDADGNYPMSHHVRSLAKRVVRELSKVGNDYEAVELVESLLTNKNEYYV